VQAYLSRATVEQALREEGLSTFVQAVLDVDNHTEGESRYFQLSLFLHDDCSEAVEQQLMRQLQLHLSRKGFTNGDYVTARRIPLWPAPMSNTGP